MEQNYVTITLCIRNVIWQKSVLTLLMNIIAGATYLLSSTYTNFRTFLYKKREAGYYVYQSSNEIDDYWVVFIVSISLIGLRKILNACQN